MGGIRLIFYYLTLKIFKLAKFVVWVSRLIVSFLKSELMLFITVLFLYLQSYTIGDIRIGEVPIWVYFYSKFKRFYKWYYKKPITYYPLQPITFINQPMAKIHPRRIFVHSIQFLRLPNTWTELLRSSDLPHIFVAENLLNFTYLKFFNFNLSKNFSVRKLFGNGFIYLRGLIVVFFIDALLTDDEPIWEPVEWSLVQNWLMFIFLFAWIAENLISSRYGSYTGRDKRVWFSWYKTFWLIEGYYVLSLGAAALFVIVPFYHELTYTTPFILSWWDWYSRTFFLKFMTIYALLLLFTNYLQIIINQSYWKKSLIIVILVNFFLAYLVYVHFFITFFAYFTDPNWYCSNRLVDYIQLSHEPSKWSWGSSKRDHFSYHNSKTVFWFKNDGPFASAMLFFNIFFFLSLFTLHIYWLTLVRRIYATSEVTFTYTTYCVSGLRQFFYFFNFIYFLTFFSYLITYWRLPLEFYWTLSRDHWFSVLWSVIFDYNAFLFNMLPIL